MNNVQLDRWQAHLRLAKEHQEQESKPRLVPCRCGVQHLPESINKTAA